MPATTTASLKELLDRRAQLVGEYRATLDRADADSRELSADERQALDRMDAELDELTAAIDSREDRQRRRERLDRLTAVLADPRPARQTAPADGAPPRPDRAEPALPDRASATVARYLAAKRRRNRPPRLTETREYHEAFADYLEHGRAGNLLRAGVEEALALQMDIDSAGGYLVASETFVMELLAALDDAVVMRRLGRTFIVDRAKSLGVPTRSAKLSTFSWSSEIGTVPQDTALAIGKRALHPHPLTGEILISRDLLASSLMPVEELVRSELARDASEVEETAFLTGTGANQPLGVFTASADGISTGRDALTGSATNFTADGLIAAFYTLKDGYRRNATWLMHRQGVRRARQLKGSDNNYLWQPGLSAGEPDTLLGRPVVASEFAPSTFTTGLYVGIVGDFSFYWIATAADIEVQALFEIAARTNQVSYIGRMRSDGAPVLEEAFVRLKTD